MLKGMAVCELRAFFKGKREDTDNLDSLEESQVLVLILSRSSGDTVQGPYPHPDDCSGSLGSEHKAASTFCVILVW